MIAYDPAIIRTFAQQLYERAATIVFVHIAIGVVLGGLIGKISLGTGGMLFFALVGGGFGYFLGSQKAFLLKLQAQLAMCQVQIENNTWGSASRSTTFSDSASAPARPPVLVPTPATLGGTTNVTLVASGVPTGQCPNCHAQIALTSEECPKCKAAFGYGSAWRIQPPSGPTAGSAPPP